MKVIKIFMVDDHRTLTDSLSEYFRVISDLEYQYQVLGRAQNGPELLQRLQHIPVLDVILMDLEMPDMSGFELLEAVLQINSRIPIIILTMHNSWAFANIAVQKGAKGYALKTSGAKSIVTAIQYVLQQKVYIDPKINPGGTEEVPVEWKPEDRAIICGILQEKTSQEIGTDLGQSESFIEGRRRHIIRATNSKNVIGIVKYALMKRICPESEKGQAHPDIGLTAKGNSGTVSVFLIDDHAVLLDSLEAMLRQQFPGLPAIDVLGKAHDGKEALEKLALLNGPDVILLDKELPDMDGIALMAKIKAMLPEVKFVMISFDGSSKARETALAAGAADYLVKSSANRATIIQAVSTALNPTKTFFERNPPRRAIPFDATDLEILDQVMQELTNEKIALDLKISVSTVAHRRAKMIETIGARSVVGLAIYAVQTGLFKV